MKTSKKKVLRVVITLMTLAFPASFAAAESADTVAYSWELKRSQYVCTRTTRTSAGREEKDDLPASVSSPCPAKFNFDGPPCQMQTPGGVNIKSVPRCFCVSGVSKEFDPEKVRCPGDYDGREKALGQMASTAPAGQGDDQTKDCQDWAKDEIGRLAKFRTKYCTTSLSPGLSSGPSSTRPAAAPAGSTGRKID